MLGQLMSKDDKEVEAGFVHISLRFLQAAEAEDKIDKFLETQSKEEADQAQRAQVDQDYNENFYISFELQFTAGCRTVENRSVINTTEVKEDKRKKEATRLKELGNQVLHIRRHQNYRLPLFQAFRRGEHGLAEEYYTSALMQ